MVTLLNVGGGGGSSSSVMQCSRLEAADVCGSPEKIPVGANFCLAARQRELLTAPHALHQVILHL